MRSAHERVARTTLPAAAFVPKLVFVAFVSWLVPGCETSQARGVEQETPKPAKSSPATPATPATPAPQKATSPSEAQPKPTANAPTLQTPARFVASQLEDDKLLERLSQAEPLSFKPVGSTSTVFHVRFKDGADAAFKAVTGNRPHGPASEVAAYRLARCLGLDNVPPAISREIPAAQIHALLDPKFEARWPEIRERMGVAEDGMVRGAAIFWIPALVDVGVDKQRGLKLVQEWLRSGGTLPKQKRSLAASLSSMLAFDYLIGNFDRWSGDNVMGNSEGTLVYMRDHDQAFQIGIGEALHRHMLHDLLLAERFSRRFHASVQRLERGCLTQELKRDPEGRAGRLLSEHQIADLLDRRQTLLSHVDSLITLHGEAEVLAFE